MKKVVLFFVIFLICIPNVLASSIVMDMDNKRVLYSNSINEKSLIASTTKIMTALLAIESNKLEEIVKIGDEVLTMYGSNIYIEKGEEILLLDLVYGLILRSGNDASVSIAKHVSGSVSKFVLDMNKKAKEIGMNNTIFNNPHGLDEETKNYSSAYDLCLLYSYAYKYPIFRSIVGTKYYNTSSSLKTYSWKNRNNLLFNYDKATGGKTGYTPVAGRILVSSASNENINLCVATIDRNSYLYDFHEQKYEYVFSNYKKYKILDKDNFYIDNASDTYLDHDFYYTLTEDEYNNLDIKVDLNDKHDNVLGKVIVTLDDEVIDTNTIYIKLEEETGIFNKIAYFFKSILKKIT
ncbi:MAG: D-alanyl-D-alanine carboxypeptidase [Firmicutes bacterium]|nr:D-alanyl-D-alanine carboxypeptidase [Bacillota bacterium]